MRRHAIIAIIFIILLIADIDFTPALRHFASFTPQPFHLSPPLI